MLRLRELRIEYGFTQKELASKIESTDKSIWAYENQIATPPLDVLEKLSDVFSCSIDYLVGRADDFGNVAIYHNTEDTSSLSPDEQRLINKIRKTPPHNAMEWMELYSELPLYMQENIFSELKGMHLGYKASKAKKSKAK